MTSTTSAPAESVVRVIDLVVRKDGQDICHVPHLEIVAGEQIGILGPNGSGKSTLLRVLAGIESDITGQCAVTSPPRQRVFVHQSPYLFRGTTIQNVAYGLRARSLHKSERNSLANEWLSRFGISELHNRDVSKLSGGERRRAALARACILEPQLLLLDEPLADLDPAGIELVQQALSKLAKTTVVVTSPLPLPAGFIEREIALTAPDGDLARTPQATGYSAP